VRAEVDRETVPELTFQPSFTSNPRTFVPAMVNAEVVVSSPSDPGG
jgi:hypothetical protein